MSRFYADIQGSRGEATRQGTPSSGIHGHIRGWNIGGRVRCYVDNDGNDVVEISVTKGSNGYGDSKCLGRFKRGENGEIEKI